MLLSVHIPKTGGVSFRNALKEFYGPGFVLSYWEVTDAWGRVLPEAPPTATCVHGHFVAHDLADRFPTASLATWVRDPAERVASSYYHRLRDPDRQNRISRLVHERQLSLLEFAELPEVRNEMAWFMGRKQPADFAFIGVMEHYEEAMARFCLDFGFPAQPVRRDNCNAARVTATYPMSGEVRARLTALNDRDAEIYSECLELFWNRHRSSSRQRTG
ncbi:MAG: Sulfotransferase family [Lacunisphaera sp.]|nr:Sulfotransferase family [Lacunisphaera sp.]